METSEVFSDKLLEQTVKVSKTLKVYTENTQPIA